MYISAMRLERSIGGLQASGHLVDRSHARPAGQYFAAAVDCGSGMLLSQKSGKRGLLESVNVRKVLYDATAY